MYATLDAAALLVKQIKSATQTASLPRSPMSAAAARLELASGLDFLDLYRREGLERRYASATSSSSGTLTAGRYPVSETRDFASRIERTNSEKSPCASRGPGAASGWNWAARIGSVRWRKPSSVPSFRLR